MSEKLTKISLLTARSAFARLRSRNMLKRALLLLPLSAIADAGLRITVTSKFASNTTTENGALDRLARAQREDDIASLKKEVDTFYIFYNNFAFCSSITVFACSMCSHSCI